MVFQMCNAVYAHLHLSFLSLIIIGRSPTHYYLSHIFSFSHLGKNLYMCMIGRHFTTNMCLCTCDSSRIKFWVKLQDALIYIFYLDDFFSLIFLFWFFSIPVSRNIECKFDFRFTCLIWTDHWNISIHNHVLQINFYVWILFSALSKPENVLWFLQNFQK